MQAADTRISVHESEQVKPYGPLTQEEAERLQQEANEDTTKSEDLRQFLKEMHEKLMEEQQQHQQQQQLQNVSCLSPIQPVSGHSHVGDVFNAVVPSDSQYSLVSPSGPDQELSVRSKYQPQTGPHAQGLPRLTSQILRPSMTDLNVSDNPPDGGWGWIVVLGSFCCMILVDGICFSYGLLLTPQCGYSSLRAVSVIRPTNHSDATSYQLRQTFVPRADRSLKPIIGSCIPVSEMGEALGTQDRALLLTPGALLIGLYLLLGPLVSALSNQFDFRPVAMAGAGISTLALFLSSFATSINFLTATLGLLGGAGFSLIYLPAIATVGHWFQQRRPLAVGLALCGSGVGCLLGAQAIPRLVEWLTWRGAIIILAAFSFQCLSLIVLFRPLEVHVRITLAQRAKRTAREAERRASALRRAEVERLLYEARQRKRMATLAKVSEQQNIGQKHGGQLAALEHDVLSTNKFDVQTGVSTHPGTGPTGAPRLSSGYRGGRSGTVISRNARGGRVMQVNLAGANQTVMPRTDSTRATGISGGWLRNRSAARGKRVPSRRVVVYRGSIMQRIIEEKRRQRTISVGSLDGMVITRDNELIAASLAPNLDRPLLSASAIHRISEAVARKIEVKMQNQLPDGLTVAPVGASRVGLSRSQLRISLPQVVQEYIQSQLSITLQQQQQQPQSQQHKQSGANFSPFYVSVSQPLSSLPAPANPVWHPTNMATSAGQAVAVDSAQLSNPSSGQTASTSVANSNGNGDGLQASVMLSQSESPSIQVQQQQQQQQQQHSVGSRLNPPLASTGVSNSNCPSESTSLRHTVSDASLESRTQVLLDGVASGVGILGTSNARLTELDTTKNGNFGTDHPFLDDEIKAEIHARLKREMSRPQYKKDLFYTGSVLQLSSNQLVADTLAGIPVGFVSPSGIIVPPATAGHRSQVVRTSTATHPSLEPTSETHNSQTNISVITATGAVTNSFIPPAPCPPVQTPVCSGATQITSAQLSTDFAHAANRDAPQPSQNISSTQECIVMGVTDTRSDTNHESNVVISDADRVSAYVCSTARDPGSFRPIDDLNPTDVNSRSRPVPDYSVDQDVLDITDNMNDRIEAGGPGEDDDDEVDVVDVDDGLEVTAGEHPSHFSEHCVIVLNTLCCGGCASTNRDFLGPMRSFVQELLSPWILASVTFGFMLLSSTATMMGFVVPLVMLPDLLAELNWQLADSGFAICAIGVGNTVGRLVATLYIEKAWSVTYKWADCLWLNNGSLFLTALSVFLMPIIRMNYSLLVLICAVFGLCSAVFVSLKSILVVELLGLDRLTNSFGYMLLFQGMAAIVGPPIAGHLRDTHLAQYPESSILLGHIAPVHRSTSVGFYFASACFLVACLLACPLRWLSRREFAATEARDSIGSMPLDMNSPGAYDFVGATNAVDGEWLATEPSQCLTNVGVCLSDAASRVSDQPDHHVEQQLLPLQQQQITPPVDGLGVSSTVTSSTLPVVASTTAPTLSGPPCMLSTINETATSKSADVLASGAVSATPNTALANTPVLDDVTGLTTTVLGVGSGLVVPSSAVGVSMISPSSSTPTVEVMKVPEESGLEPVVEEEEEDDYEEEDVGGTTVDQYLDEQHEFLTLDSTAQPMLTRGSIDSETNQTNGRTRSSTSITGTTTGGSDSSQSREFKAIGDAQSGTEPVSGQRRKRKRATRRTKEVAQAESQDTHDQVKKE